MSGFVGTHASIPDADPARPGPAGKVMAGWLMAKSGGGWDTDELVPTEAQWLNSV